MHPQGIKILKSRVTSSGACCIHVLRSMCLKSSSEGNQEAECAVAPAGYLQTLWISSMPGWMLISYCKMTSLSPDQFVLIQGNDDMATSGGWTWDIWVVLQSRRCTGWGLSDDETLKRSIVSEIATSWFDCAAYKGYTLEGLSTSRTFSHLWERLMWWYRKELSPVKALFTEFSQYHYDLVWPAVRINGRVVM